jgi:hypothetical protein
MKYAQKNLPVIIVLLALLLIIFVAWFYNKRIEIIDRKTIPARSKIKALNMSAIETTTINHPPRLTVKISGQYEIISDIPYREHIPV